MKTGKYYLISHLVLITGLTDRTLRSYIASGILQGEKIGGLWHFTPEQVDAFVRHPAVRPSILAKQNALVYDFLLDTQKAEGEVCMVLDIPGADRKALAEYFCYKISHGDYHNLRFAFDGVTQVPRILLSGRTEEILSLVNEYYA